MCAAVPLRDIIGERQNIFMIAVVPPHCDLNPNIIALTAHENGFGQSRAFRAIKVFYKFPNPALKKELAFKRFSGPCVF